MDKHEKLLEHILIRRSDSNVPFAGLCKLLKALGFDEKIRGDHHIFTMDGVEDIINLQPKGSKAKSYQVQQARNLILRYNLSLGDQE